MTVFQNKNLIKALMEKKMKEDKMEESFGIGKKSYGTETDTETWSWFWLPILKPGFGRTLGLSYIITTVPIFQILYLLLLQV